MIILLFFYDVIFLLGLLLYLPRALNRKRINANSIKQKFGFVDIIAPEQSIWIQVVSVGEVNVIGRLLERLRERHSYTIVISTTTLTGNKLAKEKYGSFAKVIFFPFDVSFIIRRVVKKINPILFIAVETEIWPNLFFHLKHKAVPILIINGRISHNAFARYKRIRSIMKKILGVCQYVAVQNEDYRNKFLSLGCPEEKIVVSGNMKFESISADAAYFHTLEKKYVSFGKTPQSLLVVAGSTHHPEEEGILDAYATLYARGVCFSLVIAPRHIERTSVIEKLITQAGFTPVRLSKGSTFRDMKKPIFILDSIGELLYFYSLADICFVGGSLSGNGGHNILEPIYFSKPTVFGPSMENFEDVKGVIIKHNAGIMVNDFQEFQRELENLMTDGHYRLGISNRCSQVFKEQKSGLEENVRLIERYL